MRARRSASSGREAAIDVLGAFCIEVRGYFAGEIPVTATAAEEAKQIHRRISLFSAQGLRGIELTGAPGGDEAGARGSESEDNDNGGEDVPVEGTHAVEHLAKKPDDGCASGEAEDETDEDGREAIG